MGVDEQVRNLQRLASSLVAVIRSNSGTMNRDSALEKSAQLEKVPVSQMRYVLTYALTEEMIKQDRVNATLTA